MLLSAKEERARRFKLALRAGIPILILVFLLFFTTFSKGGFAALTVENAFLMGGLVFITIYFIYFLLELDVKETLLDQTTEGFNYEAFLEKVQKHKPGTVAILVINNLSTINENYGTVASNRLLHTMVSRLNNCIRIHQSGESWIGRHFGAEFLIAIDLEGSELQKMLERFITENQTIDTIEIDYRFAIIAHSESTAEKTIALLKDELAAQENSRRETPEKIKDANELSRLEKETVDAVERGSLNLYFRPLYHIRAEKVDSYEISVKLKTEEGREILPRDYLPIVNRLGLGRSYDLAIFTRIVETAFLTDERISFSFNLSPFSLRDRDFLEKIFALVEERGIDTKRLIIELYEKKTHHNLGNYLKTLSRLRLKGFQVCIDNFGSSNASMEYIKHFNFDRVQFDRDFVTRLDDANTLLILKSMIDMARGMDITTVAKWVDREEQKRRLAELGIDYLQGYGIGKNLREAQLIRKYNP